MDTDVFPNSLEYWGPTGMPVVPQRPGPLDADRRSDNELVHGRTRTPRAPAATPACYADRVELQNIKPRFPVPDFTGAYKATQKWGYVAGRRRSCATSSGTTRSNDKFDLSGSATGWGINSASNLNARQERHAARGSSSSARASRTAMNDSPVDIGVKSNPATRSRRSSAKPLPIVGTRAYLDHKWNDRRTTSAVGYSRQDITTATGRRPTPSRTASTAAETCSDTPVQERDDGRRVPVGPPRELLRRLPQRRCQAAVLVQVQLLRTNSEASHGSTSRRYSPAAAALVAVATLGIAIPARAQHSQPAAGRRQRVREVQDHSRKARTPTTSRRSPRSTRISSASRWSRTDGKVYTAGDIKTEVSIQSISKVFTMAQVIQEQGLDAIEKRIGVDATGARFNSIIAVEARQDGRRDRRAGDESAGQSGRDLGHQHGDRRRHRDAVWKKIIGFHNDAAGRQLTVLQDVYKSESDTNQRNQAIGALMLRLRLHQDELAAGGRSLHAPVLDRREREGPRHDGGDARGRPARIP